MKFTRKRLADITSQAKSLLRLKALGLMISESAKDFGQGQVLALSALCSFDTMSEQDKSIELARWHAH